HVPGVHHRIESGTRCQAVAASTQWRRRPPFHPYPRREPTMTPTLTRHAATPLVDMGATPRETKLALTTPEHIRPHGTERKRQHSRRGGRRSPPSREERTG